MVLGYIIEVNVQMNKRTYQGGSTAAFVVVAIILLIGLVGVVYYARQRGEIARKEKAIAALEDSEANSDKQTDNPFDEDEAVDEETAVSNETSNVDGVDSSVGSSTELPQGGSGDLLINLFAVFAISVTLSMYLMSTRKIKPTL
jgi:cbb3-type cytochrome oxidase subunit 3